MTPDVRVEFRDVRGDRRHFGEDPPGALDDDVARLGQGPGRAVDQLGGEFGLEAGDSVGNIGLDGPERLGGAGERAVIGDPDERLELANLHVSII